MTDSDTRSTQDLRDARSRGEHVTPADFRAAGQREDASFGGVLADRAATRVADPADDARFVRDAERSAESARDRVDRAAESDAAVAGIEQMRRERQDSRAIGGPPLTRATSPDPQG